jgi:glycosyltransferase involved in cell wall biosynthesis
VKKVLYVSDASSIHTQRWLQHYLKRGNEVHVASFSPAVLPGIQVHLLSRLAVGKLGYAYAVPRLRALLSSLRPDIVHAHYVTSYGAVAALAGARPLIQTAWGSDVLLNPQRSAALGLLTRFALSRSVALTVVAEHMIEPIRHLLPPSLPVLCIPFGVDTELFRPPARARPTGGRLKVISTRHLAPIYDQPTLLKAVKLCVDRGIDLELDIIGAGPTREALEEMVSALGLDGRVAFHGRVPHDTLPGMLAAADVFVSTSLSDGNNVSLNEAMACGCFPIVTDIPANSQWVTHAENGFLFPVGDERALADRIADAAASDALRDSAAARNIEVANTRASWRHFSAQMDALYEWVLTQGSAA